MERMKFSFRSTWYWIFIGVLITWGLAANCGGQMWESCFRNDLAFTHDLARKNFFAYVNCPPGISGYCFGGGPGFQKYNSELYTKTGPCQYASGLNYCDDSPGTIEICSVMYDTFVDPYTNHRYIHSSKPPGIVYVKMKYPPPVPPPPPIRPPPGSTNGSDPNRIFPPQPDALASQAEKDALLKEIGEHKKRWREYWTRLTGGSGAPWLFPDGVADRLIGRVTNVSKRHDLYDYKQILICCDSFVESNMQAEARDRGIADCFRRYGK